MSQIEKGVRVIGGGLTAIGCIAFALAGADVSSADHGHITSQIIDRISAFFGEQKTHMVSSGGLFSHPHMEVIPTDLTEVPRALGAVAAGVGTVAAVGSTRFALKK